MIDTTHLKAYHTVASLLKTAMLPGESGLPGGSGARPCSMRCRQQRFRSQAAATTATGSRKCWSPRGQAVHSLFNVSKAGRVSTTSYSTVIVTRSRLVRHAQGPAPRRDPAGSLRPHLLLCNRNRCSGRSLSRSMNACLGSKAMIHFTKTTWTCLCLTQLARWMSMTLDSLRQSPGKEWTEYRYYIDTE